jgi:integrase
MMHARRESSQKLYLTYTNRWLDYCAKHNLHFIHAPLTAGLDFLQTLFTQGLGYSAINTARSALSAVILLSSPGTFGNHPDVVLYMKGVFNLRPTQPKYISTWDPDTVLRFLERWTPASDISLEKLTFKVLLLILLVTGQRPQVLHHLDLVRMKKGLDSYEFVLELTDLKQGRCNYRPGTLLLQAYPANKRLCIYHYLTVYLSRTALTRKACTKLFLTLSKPFKAASPNTLSRWIKGVLGQAGVDITTFTAGSTRAAAASKAKAQGAPVAQILHMGGWSRASTFTKFYDKPILPTPIADRILQPPSQE